MYIFHNNYSSIHIYNFYFLIIYLAFGEYLITEARIAGMEVGIVDAPFVAEIIDKKYNLPPILEIQVKSAKVRIMALEDMPCITNLSGKFFDFKLNELRQIDIKLDVLKEKFTELQIPHNAALRSLSSSYQIDSVIAEMVTNAESSLNQCKNEIATVTVEDEPDLLKRIAKYNDQIDFLKNMKGLGSLCEKFSVLKESEIKVYTFFQIF